MCVIHPVLSSLEKFSLLKHGSWISMDEIGDFKVTAMKGNPGRTPVYINYLKFNNNLIKIYDSTQ